MHILFKIIEETLYLINMFQNSVNNGILTLNKNPIKLVNVKMEKIANILMV